MMVCDYINCNEEAWYTATFSDQDGETKAYFCEEHIGVAERNDQWLATLELDVNGHEII